MLELDATVCGGFQKLITQSRTDDANNFYKLFRTFFAIGEQRKTVYVKHHILTPDGAHSSSIENGGFYT